MNCGLDSDCQSLYKCINTIC